jgi:hypothetical protein
MFLLNQALAIMKHFSKLLLCLSLFILFIQSSCKKEKLPPETATGANTLGCKVNGEIFVPSGGDPTIGWYPVQGGGVSVGNVNGMRVEATSKNQKFIDLYIKNINAPGIYNLDKNTSPFPDATKPESYGSYAVKDNNGNYSTFVTNSSYSGWINVKHILPGGIYAGTFEFTAYNIQTGDTVKITDGRFDVKY